jgi:hypothetical protein
MRHTIPWKRVLFEKLLVLQLVKRYPAFYINLRFMKVAVSISDDIIGLFN